MELNSVRQSAKGNIKRPCGVIGGIANVDIWQRHMGQPEKDTSNGNKDICTRAGDS